MYFTHTLVSISKEQLLQYLQQDGNGVQVKHKAYVRVNVQKASNSAFVHDRSRPRQTLD